MSMFESAMFAELVEQAQKACYQNSVDHGFWNVPNLEEWDFAPAHHVQSEDCMGNPLSYWRVWATHLKTEKVVCGIGVDPKQALDTARQNVLKLDNFGEKIALIHSELSEALEKHRKTLGKGLPDTPDEHCPEFGGITIELADTVIRILDLAGYLKIDLGMAILAKMTFNRSRPLMHGKAY